MKQGLTLLTGFGLMYLLDPDLGGRRALLRDKLTSAASRIDDCLDATWTDVRNRAQGLAAEVAH